MKKHYFITLLLIISTFAAYSFFYKEAFNLSCAQDQDEDGSVDTSNGDPDVVVDDDPNADGNGDGNNDGSGDGDLSDSNGDGNNDGGSNGDLSDSDDAPNVCASPLPFVDDDDESELEEEVPVSEDTESIFDGLCKFRCEKTTGYKMAWNKYSDTCPDGKICGNGLLPNPLYCSSWTTQQELKEKLAQEQWFPCITPPKAKKCVYTCSCISITRAKILNINTAWKYVSQLSDVKGGCKKEDCKPALNDKPCTKAEAEASIQRTTACPNW
ncbi:MAG: hypothetical protein HYY52_08995 [Candidatus Melainabacteria bacterium]|nr:hypothetical protein [Candidatus Melainabacteria bacterium]